MAKQTAAKQNGKGKAPAKKAAAKKLTRAQATAEMKKHEPAYKQYQVDRGKGVKRSENKHAAGYKAYKAAYRRLLELKREAGEIKPRAQRAEAEAPAAS